MATRDRYAHQPRGRWNAWTLMISMAGKPRHKLAYLGRQKTRPRWWRLSWSLEGRGLRALAAYQMQSMKGRLLGVESTSAEVEGKLDTLLSYERKWECVSLSQNEIEQGSKDRQRTEVKNLLGFICGCIIDIRVSCGCMDVETGG
jgi:hypothetical protein